MRSREGETHVRATTMYFGAALHTPRGGQCPSLLRPKEGAGGYGGSDRGAWRSGKGDRGQALSGKNEQTFRKTRKGTHRVLVHHSSLPFLYLVLTFMLIDELRFMLDLNDRFEFRHRALPSPFLSSLSSPPLFVLREKKLLNDTIQRLLFIISITII